METSEMQELIALLEEAKSVLQETKDLAAELQLIDDALVAFNADLEKGTVTKTDKRVSSLITAQEKILKKLAKRDERNQVLLDKASRLLEKISPSLEVFELEDFQNQIREATLNVEHAQEELREERELLAPLEASIARLKLEPQSNEIKKQLKALEKQLKDLLSEVNRREKIFVNLIKDLAKILADFFIKADPRIAVSLLSDDLPFALLPVRVETRFMIIKHVTRVQPGGENPNLKVAEIETEFKLPEVMQLVPKNQRVEDIYELWVRIYPDDIAIDTHEQRLAQDEYDAAGVFWSETWRAGGDQDLELGAWRVLANAYGSRRAAWIAQQTEPTNPLDKPSAPVPIGNPLPVDPVLPVLSIKPTGWTEPPTTRIMPDRFAVRLYDGTTYREVLGSPVPLVLQVGLDPSADYTNLLNQVNGEVNMPPELKWQTDFSEAEKVGMGIRIKLSKQEMENGFSRLLVLGLKISSNADAGKQQFEDLLEGHHYRTGFALVPQGTPTNNTDAQGSGYASLEPGQEESFRIERLSPLFTPQTDHAEKPDGQRFAEALGISNDVMAHVFHSDGTDGCESICMNRALWPATLGYYMKQMLHPSATSTVINSTKSFFTEFVHGRGLIPALRVGHQPYGVHPATVYSRWKYSDTTSFRSKLYTGILKPLDTLWTGMANDVSFVGKTNPNSSLDPKAMLVDILGLHPSSVEYYQRFTGGSYLMWNLYRFVGGAGGNTVGFPQLNGTQEQTFDSIFNSLGFVYSQIPRIFSMTFLQQHRLLNGPVIDTLLLSENRRVQDIPATTKNYIEWLKLSTLQQIRDEDFTNIGATASQKPPQALLYLLLRHAIFVEYLNASYCLQQTAGVISANATIDNELINLINPTKPGNATAETLATLHSSITAEVILQNEIRIEAAIEKISADDASALTKSTSDFKEQLRLATQTEVDQVIEQVYSAQSRNLQLEQAKWNYLSQPVPQVSGNLSMELFIDRVMTKGSPCTDNLSQVKEALNCLANVPTARLERCFAEHLDICNYRYDSWMTGLVTDRLLEQREIKPEGLFLGAYSILEEVRPGPLPGISVVEVTGASAATTSSPNLAADQGLKQPVAPAISLPPISISYSTTSFEYLGSDPFTQLMLDAASNQIIPTPRINPDNEGFILAPSMNHAVTSAILRAGYVAHRATGSNDDALAVNLTSARVRKALFYLEGVRKGQSLAGLLGYQFERGLHDAQSQTVTNYNLDQYILDIRFKYPLVSGGVVVNTPTGNIQDFESRNVTDGLKLIEAFRETSTPWDNGLSISTASKALIEAEITKITDDMDAIGDLLLSEAVYQVAKGNFERSGSVLKAMGEGNTIPEPEIINTPRRSNVVTHRFAIQLNPSSAATSVWGTLKTSRAFSEPAFNSWLQQQLPPPAKILIRVGYTDSLNLPQSITVSMADLTVEPIDLVFMFGTLGSMEFNDSAELSKRVSYFVSKNVAVSDTSVITIQYKDRSGFASDESTVFELAPVLRSLLQLLGNSRALTAEDFLTPAETSGVLQTSTAGVTTVTLQARLTEAIGPATSSGYNGLLDVKNMLTATRIAAQNSGFTSSDLDNLRDALLAAALFGIDGSIPSNAITFSTDARDVLVNQALPVEAELQKRYNNSSARMTALGSLTDEMSKARELSEIAKDIFGRNFRVFPEFNLHNTSDYTLSFNSTVLLSGVGDYAIDEWMHGASRVRPQMGNYRKLMLLAETVTNRSDALVDAEHHVVQLPLDLTGNDRWLGLEVPADYEYPGDPVSVVMELPSGYTTTQLHAGLLVDEWVEEIPMEKVTTGIAMHYDQPNNEAPQSILLAVTPEIKGNWTWNDLMDTLNETMEMAKKRAVEPDMIQKTFLSQVLPALMAPVTGSSASPSLDFGRNIVNAASGQTGPIDITQYSS